MVEMDTSIICACLPMIPGLFRSQETTPSQRSKPATKSFGSSWVLSDRKESKNGYTDIDTIGVNTTVEVHYGPESDTVPLKTLPPSLR